MEQGKSLSRKIAPTTFIGLLSFITRFVFSKSWKHRQEREPVRAGVGSLYEERKPQSAKPCLFTIFFTTSKVVCQCHGNHFLSGYIIWVKGGRVERHGAVRLFALVPSLASSKEPKGFR